MSHPKKQQTSLYENILKLRDLDQCHRFFEDLCSMAELSAIEQRFEVAQMLYEGKVYTEISEKTGASSATVSRVKRALNYGTNGLKEIIEQPAED